MFSAIMFTSNFVFRVLVSEALVVSALPVVREAWRGGGGAGSSPASTNPAPGPCSEPLSEPQPIEGGDEVVL